MAGRSHPTPGSVAGTKQIYMDKYYFKKYLVLEQVYSVMIQ
jgi:hypothetical protein